MYKVVILVAEPREQKVIMFAKKPTFDDLYPLLKCSTIEIQQCWVDNKAVDMYCDEESKLKQTVIHNEIATDLWYEWQQATGHECIPGDYIAGDVAIMYNVGKSCAADTKKFGSRT